MPSDQDWSPVEPHLQAVLSRYPDPLAALAEARVPAFIFRGAYPPSHCQGLVRRFIDRNLMRDPADPGLASGPSRETPTGTPPANQPQIHSVGSAAASRRIDIGTSLGNRGADQEAFLLHAAQTHALFKTLFEGFQDPVKTLYDALAGLAVGKRVMVAREPDGRQYGPAIFRIHYSDHAYKPHIDHVVLREKRFNYAVSRFRCQFAGVLCLQNDGDQGESSQAILHRCLWTPEIQPYLEEGTFHTYAEQRRVARCRVGLAPGDLYFFNTRCIHEVPAIRGDLPRIVLAVFVGYDPDDPEIFVWS